MYDVVFRVSDAAAEMKEKATAANKECAASVLLSDAEEDLVVLQTSAACLFDERGRPFDGRRVIKVHCPLI